MTETGAFGLPFFIQGNPDFPQKSFVFALTPFSTGG
jgi:hypothetical protein